MLLYGSVTTEESERGVKSRSAVKGRCRDETGDSPPESAVYKVRFPAAG